MKIIKSLTYNVVSTDPFDIPLPLEFELMSGNSLLASYKIHENGQVDYKFNGAAKDRILTSTARPLELNDIYFLFSSRVFADKTPFTESELERFGVEEYNPYEILKKTHGVMPSPLDRYWIKFAGESLTYKKVSDKFAEYFNPASEESADSDTAEGEAQKGDDTIYSLDSIMNQKSNEYTSINDVSSILSEGKLDVHTLAANVDDTPITETVFAPGVKKGDVAATAVEEEVSAAEEAPVIVEESDGDSGGNMSPDAIATMLAAANPAEEAAASEPSESEQDLFIMPEISEVLDNTDKKGEEE